MKVNNIFNSIQGEGRYQGEPVLFIRLSGCNRNCSWCDTKYHKEGKEINTENIIKEIDNYKGRIVVWTGGEPLLQLEEIKKVIEKLKSRKYVWNKHHLETNGDLLLENHYKTLAIIDLFDYLCVSPKSLESAKIAASFWISNSKKFDVKVVTDMTKVNLDLIPFASMLMPLTTQNVEGTKEIQKKVWEYCLKHNLFYSARLHVEVWGRTKRGI